MIRWLHADKPHHSAILVFQEMAMIQEGADSIRIAEIHS